MAGPEWTAEVPLRPLLHTLEQQEWECPMPDRAVKPSFVFEEIQQRAHESGCYMQMFVAYNPDTGTFICATNDPDVTPEGASSEAMLLCAIAAEHLVQANGSKQEDGAANAAQPKFN